MTNVTEAKLAREAGICYATVALVTDYDCWREGEEAVTLEAVLEIMHNNVELAQLLVKKAVIRLTGERKCSCGVASRRAVVTDNNAIPDKLKKDYEISSRNVCKHLHEFNKENYLIDIDFECEREEDAVFFDIYGQAIGDSEVCLD